MQSTTNLAAHIYSSAGINLEPNSIVKSIWLCMGNKEDAIIRYRFVPEIVYGNPGREMLGGQMEGIIIHLRSGDKIEKSKNTLIAMLEDLLKKESTEEKKNNMAETYGLEMTREMEGRMNQMGSYSEFIREEGLEAGMEKGRISMISKMLKKGMAKDQILALDVSEEELAKAEKILSNLNQA